MIVDIYTRLGWEINKSHMQLGSSAKRSIKLFKKIFKYQKILKNQNYIMTII